MPSAESVGPAAPIRCLVVQLARLGDTLQSLMALRAAKQLYPQLEIYFLAREKFSGAASRVPWIKKVITLPTESLLGPVISGQKQEVLALGDIARWIAPLVKDPWDLIVNWSYSEASSYLTGLLPGRVKLGYTRRRDSSFSGADGWSHYIQAIIQGSVSQNIHLTDILTTQLLTALQIHIGDPLTNGNSPVTSKTFFNLSLDQTPQLDPLRKWITLQVGCGQDAKTWDPKRWAKLVEYIVSRNPDYGVVLVGGKEDQERAKILLEEISHLDSVVSLVGETNFDLWASAIGKSQWLFSGDTAAIHLASVLGTRVLNLSIGPVRFSETGPYGNGHYILTSALECNACTQGTHQIPHSCKEDVTPEAAYAVWSYATLEWSHFRQIPLDKYFAQLGWTSHLDSLRVYRSRIRHSNDGGGVVYESIIRQNLRLSDWTGMAMGHVARSWYCGWTPPIGQELQRDFISPALVQRLRQLQESSEVLSKIFTQASQTAGHLNKKGTTLKSESIMGIRDRQELQRLGKTLLDLENLVDQITKTQPALLGFSQMAKVLMHNLRGSHLTELGKETASYYLQLNEGVQIFRAWIKHTLELVKPVAVKTQGTHLELSPKP